MVADKSIVDNRDATLILAHVLGRTKEYVLAHPEHKLTAEQKSRFLKLLERRARHEPLAYLTGHKEFYGLDFKVNRHVLIPRPETETLVDAVLNQLRVTSYELRVTLIDIGTGSGAIAIALAKSLQSTDYSLQTTDYRLQIFATDISEKALSIARTNARRHGVKIKFLHGNLLEPFLKKITSYQLPVTSYNLIITANLPYLTTQQWRNTQPDIKNYEPRGALNGGKDGLKYYRQLLNELRIMNYELGVTLFIEYDPAQTRVLTKLVKNYFPTARIEIKKDLASRNRILIAEILNSKS